MSVTWYYAFVAPMHQSHQQSLKQDRQRAKRKLSFEVNDRVWLYAPAKLPKGKTPKIAKHWSGHGGSLTKSAIWSIRSLLLMVAIRRLNLFMSLDSNSILQGPIGMALSLTCSRMIPPSPYLLTPCYQQSLSFQILYISLIIHGDPASLPPKKDHL